MFLGKVSAVLKFLEESRQNGVLPPTPVVEMLQEKHPPAETIQPESLLNGPLFENINPIHFAGIDEQTILKAAMQTKGSCGYSNVDSDQFRRILCSKHFNAEGKDQIALFAQKIATECLDPSTLESYTPNRLIPLNKDPVVSPIGVGEVLRRIIAWPIQEV
jgi:hypothetical protein